jgi:predicted phage baseplate assembly protein
LQDQRESTPTDNDFEALRNTAVYAESELLELAEEPIDQPVCGGADDLIELDGFYEGLEAGRWVVVSGEREIGGTSGVRFSELSMLSTVSQSVQMQLQQTSRDSNTTPPPTRAPLPGDKTHTFIKLAAQLAYCFKRATVKIYGNVVLATHGETRTETLGSGDGSKPLQQFNLKQPPLTFVAASNPSGVDSTLKVYVNDVQWRESKTLLGLNGKDRRFVTQTDDEGKTALIFGNGREGARLPTGIENVRAVYRNGIGKGGNVKAEQISLLSTRPLGAKEVINPLPASGGADKETRDQARKNAPLAVMALDRLVSVQDYEDFARVFAGIGKARAAELSDGRRQIVHLTIAGADDIPIETHSDLYRNLTTALRRFGDPYQPFRIELRELKLLVLSARVRIHPDYLWEKVEPKIRATLLDAFSFERRELGQDALLSEAISAMQSVIGVEYVDVDTFGGVSEKISDPSTKVRRLRTPAEIADEVQVIVDLSQSQGPAHRVSVNLADFEGQSLRPAQLAYLSPLIPATLILNEVPR